MQALGFPWAPSRVAAFERGSVSPTLGILVALTDVLSEETGLDVRLEDLLAAAPGDDEIELASGVTTKVLSLKDALIGAGRLVTHNTAARQASVMRAVENGEGSRWRGAGWTQGRQSRVMSEFGTADVRAARNLGIPLPDFLTIAATLWGQSLIDEREQMLPAGSTANPQAMGRATRTLMREAQQYMDDHA